MTTLSVGMIVRDEAKNILTSLNSLIFEKIPIIDNVIIVDTGSKDNTKEIIRNWCEEHKVKYYIGDSEWTNDFSEARNKLLKFAESLTDWLLLLDASDEVKDGQYLKIALKHEKHKLAKVIGFNLRQIWKVKEENTEYRNIRLIRMKGKWKYYEPVHEYIKSSLIKSSSKYKLGNIKDTYIYQNRDTDGDKSEKRFARDVEILSKVIKKDPTNERAYFYLAQTYKCMRNFPESFKYYQKRSEMGGFKEEVYQSLYNCAMLFKMSMIKDDSEAGVKNRNFMWDKCMFYFGKSLEVFLPLKRVEPLVEIAQYFYMFSEDGIVNGDQLYLQMAYQYCLEAVNQKYPEDQMLFISKYAYDKFRYELMLNILKKMEPDSDIIGNKDKYKELYHMCLKMLDKANGIRELDQRPLET